jgi:CBS domain containing-hemolysin-like protein
MKIISKLFFWRDKKYIINKINSILDRAKKSGVIDYSSREMIDNILVFAHTLVREIMIPRTEMVAVSADATTQEIIEQAIESRYTRIPVYQGTIDNIVGILNVKDLLKFWSQDLTQTDILGQLTKPYYIPETKNTHLLFYELKENKKHIAIVIDEYGGTSGLVTLEDLLEEIVGEIRDEHDSEESEEDIISSLDGSLIVDGRTDIEKIEEYLNIELEKGRYETISGMILDTTKKIPLTGEYYQIQGLDITIEKADERSIKKVRIIKPNAGGENEK